MNEKRIANLMETLKCSREEAISVIEDDARIDKGEKLFELDSEQKKNAKAATITSTGAKTERKPREKKENTDKQALVQMLIGGLGEVDNLTVANAEREFTFTFNGNKYKVVLSAPRS